MKNKIDKRDLAIIIPLTIVIISSLIIPPFINLFVAISSVAIIFFIFKWLESITNKTKKEE